MSKTTELAKPADYAIVKSDRPVGELIATNLGTEKLSPFDLTRVPIPSGGALTFAVPSITGTKAVEAITGVIVFTKLVRVWWQSTYEEEPDMPPDCFSEDGIHGQGEPARKPGVDGLCEACEYSQWGSARNGGGGCDCNTKRPIFMVRENDRLPIQVQISPASIKNARAYLLGLVNEGLEYHEVVTTLSLVEARRKQGGLKYAQVEFTCAGTLDGEVKERFAAYRKSIEPMLAGMKPEDLARDTSPEESAA